MFTSIFNDRLPENGFLGSSIGTGKTIVARWMLDGYFVDRSVYTAVGHIGARAIQSLSNNSLEQLRNNPLFLFYYEMLVA